MPETAFTALIALQFAVIVSHDWIDIRGWNHGSQVQQVVGRRKLAIATAINAIFPGAALALALWFWRAPKPELAMDYWILYCGVTVASAIFMWYVPYFLGANETTRREYTGMYAGTRQVLPARGDNPRPNLLHIGFHALFLATLALAIAIRLGA
jgi:hypothetical protein